MAIKLADLKEDSWHSILRAVPRGDHPQLKHLVAALRRQEKNIPGDVQLYLADRLTGTTDRRGRPRKAEPETYLSDLNLIYDVHEWANEFRADKKRNAQN